MPKKLIRSWLPEPGRLAGSPALRWLGPLLKKPGIWHLNRRSAAGAFAIGFFVMFLPVPFQMALAALLAIGLNGHLPLSVCLVWISNPVTMGPMWYLGYMVGANLLETPVLAYSSEVGIAEALAMGLQVLAPLTIGCLICGALASVLGYLALHGLWRFSVVRDWQRSRAVIRAKRLRLAHARGKKPGKTGPAPVIRQPVPKPVQAPDA